MQNIHQLKSERCHKQASPAAASGFGSLHRRGWRALREEAFEEEAGIAEGRRAIFGKGFPSGGAPGREEVETVPGRRIPRRSTGIDVAGTREAEPQKPT